MRDRFLYKRGMGLGRRDQVDQVRLFHRDCLVEVGVDVRDAEAVGQGARLGPVAIDDADAVGITDALPAQVLELAEVAGADAEDFQRLVHLRVDQRFDPIASVIAFVPSWPPNS